MKIVSSDILMNSARAFAQASQKKEELNVWIGRRPDGVVRSSGVYVSGDGLTGAVQQADLSV